VRKSVYWLVAASSLIVGCETTGFARNTDSSQVGVETASVEDGYILTRIAESSLPEGKCGMVLWTLEQERPEPIFRYVVGETGSLSINGEPVELKRLQAEGARAFGIAEAQSFTDATAQLQVTVVSQIGLGFDGGAYLERGLITIDNQQGWRTITPTAGITGCRSKS